ncbi:hypothetical protein ELZ19_06755 [Brucella abortus]|uniref:hypothetical protein n=1 Tax=Brucella abortus TaxID=235 RepID=UPI0004E8FF35|nr:hypothetical protein [Brucella abortus]KFH18421.1 hypothetical protein IB60_17070 [Brucella abortus LMN1]RUQ67349.1 hypothetical protein ELZ23_15590 [Brucella abortus]RUQ77623.1 hypothetical protein ELZ22_17680 [Brucella abortus]RUQ88264.1 hypothetical protein ELZ18_15490 [Brucella abortus]RUQ90293.1 hypothetical protein ELZ20_15485 [Brucella abortus]
MQGLPTNPEDYKVRMIERCDRETYKAAVVDLLGWKYQGSDGRVRTVTETTHPFHRYEVRSKQHVKVYGFKVVHTNAIYGED